MARLGPDLCAPGDSHSVATTSPELAREFEIRRTKPAQQTQPPWPAARTGILPPPEERTWERRRYKCREWIPWPAARFRRHQSGSRSPNFRRRANAARHFRSSPWRHPPECRRPTRPPSVIRLIVSPIALSTASEDRTASGIEIAMIKVLLHEPRNSRIIKA